jgi:uncharacterized protein involved in exopolysaccharide biosynthesis
VGIREFIIYAQVIRRRWKPIVGLFLGTMITLIALSILAPRVYVASTRLQVIAPPPGAVTLYSGFRSGGFRDEIAYTQNAFIEILQSKIVARRVVEAIGGSLSEEELQDSTEIALESDFIKVTVTAEEADEAAQLSNGLASEALDYYGEILAQSSAMSREFVSAQLELARQELDRAQTDLMRFKIENKIGLLDNDISQQTNLIRSLRRSRDDAIASNDTAKANAYETLVAEREQELQVLLNLSAEYQALQSAVAQAASTYDYLLSKEAEAKITENQIRNISFILVVEPATPPRRSTSSFSKTILALGAVLSLVLGVTVAFVWEYVETSDIRREETCNDSLPQQQPACVN